jgi:hypothetical protein
MIKTWIKIVVVTSSGDQNISIFPNEVFDGIIIEVEEPDATPCYNLHLDKDEMETVIQQMRNMMDYVLKE